MGLWEVLETADARNIANVRELSDYAAGKLILVREAFPDYTMHDERHAGNVIALIEQLLGPGIGQLTPLEAGMLILAAYFHDIGMVYSPDELADLIRDQDFADFLDANPAAYVRVHQADGVPPAEVIVQYCRSRHAVRVAEHLFQLGSALLSWDSIPITGGLAALCESHNEPVDALRTDRFPAAFLGSCDLRMCAILLRLADILDLGVNRSPVAVYDHLRLASAAEGPRAVSNTEWSKHLAFRGFRFPEQRTPSYTLLAFASPRKPAVENAIRKFLDVIEEEMRSCRIVLDFCDQRWRSLPLPGGIDRGGIVSDGYRYGEYRFVLDRHEVLRLFMGEQLYANRYAFIRELLQNSVDACRLNTYLHDADPASMEVRVTAWEDEGGHFWFRVDDSGVGMDQEIVEKYFLGVGKSYYRSDDLQADILRKNRPQQQFVAISRFGIGVLSSFMAGDRIEVSTRRILPDGKLAAPLRLSLDSIDDFFVMQERPMAASPMPSRNREEPGYRKGAGTSIAVRIDPAKADVSIQTLLENAEKAFFFPPVRVYINDVEQAQCAAAELDKPIAAAPVRYHVQNDPAEEHAFDLQALSELSLIAIPLDLSAHSPSPAVRGQLIAITAEATGSPSFLPAIPSEIRAAISHRLIRALHECVIDRSVSMSLENKWASPAGSRRLNITVRLHLKREVMREFRSWLQSFAQRAASRHVDDYNLRRFLDDLKRPLDDGPLMNEDDPIDLHASYSTSYEDFAENRRKVLRSAESWLGHNGISVSSRIERESAWAGRPHAELLTGDSAVLLGAICLFDHLRPDVSISRDILRDLPFAIRSAIQLAVRRSASAYLGTAEDKFARLLMETSLLRALRLDEQSVGNIQLDPFVGKWETERIIRIPSDPAFYSVEEIRSLAEQGLVEVSLPSLQWWHEDYYRDYNFYDVLQLAMTQLRLDVEMSEPEWWGDRNDVTLRSGRPPVLPTGLPVLPPFMVAPYSSPDMLIAPRCSANLRHPVVGWFAENASTLSDEYPAFFAQIRRALEAVAKLGFASTQQRQLVADDAARQLNATIDRLRRSGSSVPVPSFREITADGSGRLI